MMTIRFARILFVLAAPLLLASCLLPGRFTATLDIGRDRSFTFAYVGEAVVIDPGSTVRINSEDGGEAPLKMEPEEPREMSEADRQRVIAALSREVGFRSVEYSGENKFRIDYRISGRLDRSFAFPVNLEGLALIPWLVVEVRGDGTAQVSAHGFGDGDGNDHNPNSANTNPDRRGTFTLTTDADLVQHNSAQRATPGGRSTLTWEVTPETQPVPSALLRFAD